MKKLLILLFLINTCIASSVFAGDKKIVTTNQFLLNAFDTSSIANSITGLSLTDVVIKVECIGGSVITIDESGDTWAEEGNGTYSIITNDTITTIAEDEWRIWIEGQSAYANLIAYAPIKFKSVANIESDTKNVVDRLGRR